MSEEEVYTKIEVEIPEKVKILGISGSHTRNGNTDFICKTALDAAKKLGPWVETEFLRLVDYDIGECDACSRCYIEAYDEHHICFGARVRDDDMNRVIYAKLLEADGYLVATPIYWGSMSGRMKDFIDRTLPFCHGSTAKFSGSMSGKVAGALVCGWDNHGGQELTAMDLHAWMLTQDMIVVGAGYHHPHAGYVGGMVSEQIASMLGVDIMVGEAEERGGFAGMIKNTVKYDVWGMRSVHGIGRRVAEVALFTKLGWSALKKWGEKYLPKYEEGKVEIDWDKFYRQNIHLTREHVGVPGRIGTSKEAFEKWFVTLGKRYKPEVKERIRKAWTEHHKAVLLSDAQLLEYSPEFYGCWVKKKET